MTGNAAALKNNRIANPDAAGSYPAAAKPAAGNRHSAMNPAAVNRAAADPFSLFQTSFYRFQYHLWKTVVDLCSCFKRSPYGGRFFFLCRSLKNGKMRKMKNRIETCRIKRSLYGAYNTFRHSCRYSFCNWRNDFQAYQFFCFPEPRSVIGNICRHSRGDSDRKSVV